MTSVARSSVGSVAFASVVASDARPAAIAVAAPPIVSEICAPALLLGAQLRSATAFGDPQTLRRRMSDMLERIEHQLADARVAPPDVTNILFALTASLDESISQSSWDRRAEWVAAPLCFDRFNRLDGGEEFFARLTAVQSTKPMSPDVLQIYFLCLTLGFKGRYLLRSDEDWHELVAQVGGMVRTSADQSATALGPHGMPGEVIAEIVREIPLWVFAVTGVGLAALIYFALTLMINWRANALEQLIR